MEQILGDSLTDESVQARIFCLSAMPDAKSKQEAWNKIQNVGQTTKLSQKEMEQVIYGFSTKCDQPELTKKLNNEFFATLYDHYKTSTYSLFKTYIKAIVPR